MVHVDRCTDQGRHSDIVVGISGISKADARSVIVHVRVAPQSGSEMQSLKDESWIMNATRYGGRIAA